MQIYKAQEKHHARKHNYDCRIVVPVTVRSVVVDRRVFAIDVDEGAVNGQAYLCQKDEVHVDEGILRNKE